MLTVKRIKVIKKKLLDLYKEFDLLEQEMEEGKSPQRPEVSPAVKKNMKGLLDGAYAFKKQIKNP